MRAEVERLKEELAVATTEVDALERALAKIDMDQQEEMEDR